jgi:hypothetical protein
LFFVFGMGEETAHATRKFFSHFSPRFARAEMATLQRFALG